MIGLRAVRNSWFQVSAAGNCKIVISIEAKADEPFDKVINQKSSTNPRTNIYKRIDFLSRSIFGDTIKENKGLGELRYQLLTGVAGVLIEAQKHDANYAVFAIHEFFSEDLDDFKLNLNKNDLNRFVGKLVNQEDFTLPTEQLIEINSILGGKYVPGDIPLLIGKVSTNIHTGSSTNVEGYLPYRMIIQTIYEIWEGEEEYNFDSDLLKVEEELELEDNNRFEINEISASESPDIDFELDLDMDRVDAKTPYEYEEWGDEIEPFERESNWLIGLSGEFIKSIKKVDKKIKGRILEAIQLISKNPTMQKGDTIKPLADRFKGLWRYRIGDYRLVYRPDKDSQQITLLLFGPRSNIYQ